MDLNSGAFQGSGLGPGGSQGSQSSPAVAGATTVRIKGMIGGLVDLPWVRYGVARDHGLSTAPATEAQI